MSNAFDSPAEREMNQTRKDTKFAYEVAIRDNIEKHYRDPAYKALSLNRKLGKLPNYI